MVPGLETAVGLKEGALGMEATVTPPTPIRAAVVTPQPVAAAAVMPQVAAGAITINRRLRVTGDL